MGNLSKIEKLEERVLKELVEKGCREVSSALSTMLGVPIKVSGGVVGFVPIAEIPMLTGAPEGMVTAARVALGGDLSGFMIFMLTSSSWDVCKKLLNCDLPEPKIELSAFAELANIACSFFIKNLSNKVGLAIPFSPPEIMEDMTATVLEDTLIMFSEEPTLLTVEIMLSSEKARLKGYLFFIPAEGTFRNLMERFSKVKPAAQED